MRLIPLVSLALALIASALPLSSTPGSGDALSGRSTLGSIEGGKDVYSGVVSTREEAPNKLDFKAILEKIKAGQKKEIGYTVNVEEIPRGLVEGVGASTTRVAGA